MKLTVRTQSGSVYEFDNEAKTWTRANEKVPDITFMEGVSSGVLAHEVEPVVGERLIFFLPDDNSVITTRVVEITEHD